MKEYREALRHRNVPGIMPPPEKKGSRSMPRMPIMNFSCCAAVILGAGVLAGCSISSSDGNQGSIGQQIGLIPMIAVAYISI